MKSSDYEQWSKLEVTPLGVDVAVFEPRPFDPAPAVFRLVCAARLAPVKGQHILIAAMEILVKQGRSVAVHLAGGGPDRQSLERDVKARGLETQVIFEGLLNQDRLRQLYRDSHAMALMEAMAMEIPCVTTWITGVPELIENRKDGLLVAPGDEAALADAIGSLMDDAELRLRLGRAGRLKVMEKYDLRINGAKLAEIFRRLLA
jgi:glycosyltransferase involved in cell wall biosynthesis